MRAHPEKAAIIEALRAYGLTYGGVLPEFLLTQMSEQHGVTARTLRRWISDDGAAPSHSRKRRSGPFSITEEHLVTIRSTLNLKAAHDILFPDPTVEGSISYPQFTRAFKRVPASIRDGIMDGWDGMTKRQVYLSMAAPHKNHTWHLDHTQADIWVYHPKHGIFRPWVSAVRDNATTFRLAATVYVGRPNEDSICDLLATAALPREWDTPNGVVVTGGLPVQLTLDNAAEHFAQAVTRGQMLLGIVSTPTKAYYKHQNGPAESTFSSMNKQLLKGLPGYSKGGVGDNGDMLVMPGRLKNVDPASVLTIEGFQKRLDGWLIDTNTSTKVHRLGNQTPLTAWGDDPTVIRFVPDETLRVMMQRASFDRAVNAEGIRFRGIDYLAPELNYYRERGLKLGVRFLQRETRWIEVFHGPEWICRAYDRNLLSEVQRRAILANRAKDLDLLKRVNASANQARLHRMLADDDAEYEDAEPDSESQAAVDAAVGQVTDLGARSRRKASRQPTTTNADAAAQAVPQAADRVDPTRPDRKRIQPAPPRSAAKQRRAAKKTAEAIERIQRRPGTNFGGLND